jgi:drug/metabolite transporter (DMT)-like permease
VPAGARLAIAVTAASWGAILVRYAVGAEPLALAFWRCAAGAALLVPFAAPRLRALGPRDVWLPALAGAFLALHFATWITSLRLTTVAASVLLVSTSPIFVALAARALLGERLTRRGWAGIALALAGTLLIGGADLGGASLVGNTLALAGGAAGAGYVLAGQVARQRLGNREYAAVTYAVAAALLGLACLAGGVALWDYPAGTWWAIVGLVAGPQMLRHTLINLVLKVVGATTVSVAMLAEPILSTALAFLLFGEVPSPLVYPGGAAVLAGIYLVSRAR